MLIKVNKKISSRKPVKYAAMSSGTISHVWYDDDSATGSKRKNRIRLTYSKELPRATEQPRPQA